MQRFFVMLMMLLALSTQAFAQQRIAVTTIAGAPIQDGAKAYNGTTIAGTCDYSYNPMYLHAYRIHLTLKGTAPGNPNDWVICQPDGTWSATLHFSSSSNSTTATPQSVYYTFHAYPCPSTMACAEAEAWDLAAYVDPASTSGAMGGNSSNRTLELNINTAAATDKSTQEGYLAAFLGGQLYWVEHGDEVVGDSLCKTPGTYSLRDAGSLTLTGCYKYIIKPYAGATTFGRVVGCPGTSSCKSVLSINFGPITPVGISFIAGTGANITDMVTNQRLKIVTTY